MTTNYKCNLDKALHRPGRVDMSIHFDYACKEQIEEMFKKFFKERFDFEDFYKNIKNLNLTTAILQQYFFSNLECEDITENIDELKQLAKENNYDSNVSLYT